MYQIDSLYYNNLSRTCIKQ